MIGVLREANRTYRGEAVCDADDYAGSYVFAYWKLKRYRGWWFGVVRDRHPDDDRRRFMVFCRSVDRSGETESDITNFSCVALLPTTPDPPPRFDAAAESIADPQNRDHARSILRALRSGAPVAGHADARAELLALVNRVVRVRCEGSGEEAFAHVLTIAGRTAHAHWLLSRGDVLRYRAHPATAERTRRALDAARIGEDELLYADWPDALPLASLREPVPLRLLPPTPLPARFDPGPTTALRPPGPGLYCRFLCRCRDSGGPARGAPSPADTGGGGGGGRPADYAIDFDPRWGLLPLIAGGGGGEGSGAAAAAAAGLRGAAAAAARRLAAAYAWRAAVAMARHPRLGAASPLGRIDDRLLADIADAAGAGAGWAM